MTREEFIRNNSWILKVIRDKFELTQAETDYLNCLIEVLEQIPDLKEAYRKGYNDGQEALAFHLELCKDEGSIVTVPDGTTNGDVIKALFPELKLSVTDGKVFVRNEGDIYLKMCFSWEWWNSPYRKEQE